MLGCWTSNEKVNPSNQSYFSLRYYTIPIYIKNTLARLQSQVFNSSEICWAFVLFPEKPVWWYSLITWSHLIFLQKFPILFKTQQKMTILHFISCDRYLPLCSSLLHTAQSKIFLYGFFQCSALAAKHFKQVILTIKQRDEVLLLVYKTDSAPKIMHSRPSSQPVNSNFQNSWYDIWFLTQNNSWSELA